MAKVVRHRSVTIQDVDDEEGEILLRLKKWSAAKLFFLIREFWGLIEEGLTQVHELDKMTEVQLIRIVVERLLSSEKQAAKIIETSVDDPRGITAAAILEWDASDFILVLTEVVDMNLTEELVKNFRRLLENFKKKTRSEKPKKTPEPEPVMASSV